MKKIIISMLAVATLAACSKEENSQVANTDGLVPIELTSGIALATRAPITVSETVQIGVWESASTVAYTNAPVLSTSTVQVVEAATDIQLSPAQYYNAENNIKSYLKGWYPQGTPSNGKVTFTNTDGTVDAILSNEVSGSKDSKVSTAMTFSHMTAQVVFKVMAGTGLASGTKIKTIKVKGASIPTGFDLTKTGADAMTWTSVDAAGLLVPNLATPIEIKETAAPAGKPVMVQPMADNTTLKLYVETTLDDTTPIIFDDVAFTTDGSKIEAGKAYTITLTFGQAGITPTANITDWVSAGGSGNVQ